MIDAVRNGKGFVVCHSASHTFHAGEDQAGTNRSLLYKKVCFKGRPVHGEFSRKFVNQSKQQDGPIRVVDHRFPILRNWVRALSDRKSGSHKGISEELHVLLVRETAGLKREMNTNANCIQQPGERKVWEGPSLLRVNGQS